MSAAADAIAKARAIAAKLGMGAGGGAGGGAGVAGGGGSDLGKRKNRDEGGGSYYQPQASGAGLGLMTKKKVYIPIREYPDVNFLGLLIGPRGRTQKELEARTGARILVRGRGSQKDHYSGPTGNPDDDDDQHVSIEGTEEAVAKAQAEVEELLFNPEKAQQIKNEQLRALSDEKSALQKYSGGGGSISTNSDGESSVELQVPNHLVGFIIGKSGEHIQKLQRETGAHCQIAKEADMRPGDTMRSVVLTGSEGGVREAKRMVDELVQEKLQGSGMGGRDDRKPKDNQDQLDRYSMILKVAVPNDKVGLIIGKQGATVKGIQDKTMTFIHIPTSADEDDRNVRTLSIAGDTRESVEAAQMEIAMQLQQNIMQRSQEAAGGLGYGGQSQSNVIYCVVPDDKVGIVIGRGGCTIKDIQNRNNVKIQIPPTADAGSNPPVRTVSIQGGPNEQMSAKYEIENMVGGVGGGYHGGQGGGHYGNNGGGNYGQQNGSYYAPQQQQGSYYQAQPAHGQYGQQQQMYQQQPQQQTQHQASTEAAVNPADLDPTAYYTDFWNYAAYYGEAAARQYYTTWSPPEGTPPPEGMVIPPPASDVNTNTSDTATTTAPATSTDATTTANGHMTAEQQQAIYQEQWAEYYKQQALLQQQQQEGVSSSSAPGDSQAPPVPENNAPPLPP